MFEILGSIAAGEAGKFVLEKGLELGQAAAEDYVKDFFKDALKGELGAKPEVAKKAVGEALKAFLGLVVEELEDCEVAPAGIRNGYEKLLMAFVKDDLVKPILGGAFERECRAIDTVILAKVWAGSEFKKKPFPEMPDGFDWERVGKEYLKKVRKIVRSSEELRSLLQTELLEAIANQQVSPGFEVSQYRDVLRCSYGVLKLSTIDSTDQQYRMRLWNVFVEQTVREALPPSRYELPIDVRREVRMTEDLDGEALEGYRREYLQQPARKVLAAIGSPLAPNSGGTGVGERIGSEDHGVILGDPGAGKSTVLQYLAIEWAEGRAAVLPLLIELQDYALWGASGFLEFLHCGRGADWCFDRVQLDAYLRENSTLLMLDGLDEVFDRSMQAAIVDEIIRFSHQYPKVRILVTSRVVGYNPDRLQNAGFRHFTIQSLEVSEIHEFIDKWYDLAMPGDIDRDRLKRRLKDAIGNSKAIGNLADNLLLLTMMVILNRRQELPRDRSELYEQATRVLLHHWDVDHKSLQLKEESIGRREKQAMLRAVAYEMQTSESGLKGNLITADRLTQVLTGYLREQGFEAPREKANGLIEQLRSRNWILCDRGADTYGFVHRTFLEYFCAMEIVHRFEKVRSLTFEQLRDEVFGQHWQDETWHEVLKLICGAVDPHFVSRLIYFLLSLFSVGSFKHEGIVSIDEYLEHDCFYDDSEHYKLILENVGGDIELCISLIREVNKIHELRSISNLLIEKLQIFMGCMGSMNSPSQGMFSYGVEISSIVIQTIAKIGAGDERIYQWLVDTNMDIQLHQLHEMCLAAMYGIVNNWRNNDQIFSFLYVASVTSYECCVESIEDPSHVALKNLASRYPTHPKTIELLNDCALNDPDEQLREWAIGQLKTYDV